MSFQNIKNKSHARLFFLNPKLFFSKAKRKIETFGREFFIDPDTRAFIDHNRKVWRGFSSRDSDKVILTDFHNLTELNVASCYFMNVLARKHTARIVSFGRSRSLLARGVHAVYCSFNGQEHLATGVLTLKQKRRRDRIVRDIIGTLKNKKDVFDITVDGIPIGMDVYETYLKEFNKPTVQLDQGLFAVIQWAVGSLIVLQDYLNRREVCAVVLSHDAYVHYNILARIAYQKKIPVYLPDFFHAVLAQRPFSVTSRFKSYPSWFENLDASEQRQAVELARRQLEKRFSGKAEGDILYGAASPFGLAQKQQRVLKTSDRIKVLICSHCFFDNPHAYGGMIFLDFYEWLKFLAGMAKKTDYDWYLKTHPDPLPGTLETIRDILGNDSAITILPPETPHHQLVREGIDVVLTVYGTVGHEYPAFGVQVVNAGYNPHVAFDFTWTPKDIKEYEQYLLGLPHLKKNIDKEEIYRFYFMHYYYCRIDDLVYDSYRQFTTDLTPRERISSRAYAYFLKTWTPAKHARIIERYCDFIDSGKQYLFMKGPVDEQVAYAKEVGYLS